MHACSEWVTCVDGSRAYYARTAAAAPAPAIVVYIEAYGLNAHFQRLAGRLAEAGFVAIVPDLYDGATYGYDDHRGAIGHLQRLAPETALARTEQALAYLATRPEVRPAPVGALGFCMGGYLAFLAATALPARIAATSAFYGGGIAPAEPSFGRPQLLGRAAALAGPVQLWYGLDDSFIRPDEHARIAAALGTAGKTYELHALAGATHGFFCEDRGSHAPAAAARAWPATLAFFRDHLA